MLYNINKDNNYKYVFNNPDKPNKILAYMFNMANDNRMLDLFGLITYFNNYYNKIKKNRN